MIKTLVRRLTVGASTLCFLCLLIPVAQAQVSESERASLLPLEPRTFEIEESVNFDTVASNINTYRTQPDTAATKSAGLDLASLPIVGDLLDEDGHLDMGLPFNVDFGDLMGEQVVIVGTDFPVR